MWFIPHNALAEKVAQEQSPQSETISNCPERNNQDWTDQIDGKFRSHGIHFCDCRHRHKVRAWAGPCDISLAEGACTCDICTGSEESFKTRRKEISLFVIITMDLKIKLFADFLCALTQRDSLAKKAAVSCGKM